ncbi:MAG TPA: hypothetical protein PLQ57_10685 [Saprospiraceae bacterium]|nr:hypothetical protein [Saprospiraceae bacterium]HRG65302.1 hypothetical protein [Saprospiraceae bacterium]
MKLISLAPLFMMLAVLWQEYPDTIFLRSSHCHRIDSIVYNEDREQVQHFNYNSYGQLASIVSGADTTLFIYLDKALMRINVGKQNDWDASQYYALDKNGRISQGMVKDKSGDLQIESGFEYDDLGRLGYAFYATYANQTYQQFAYRYPSKEKTQVTVSDQGNQVAAVYNIVLDTLAENCLNLDLNGIGHDLFPDDIMGIRETFPVHSITQLSASGDTLAHLTFSKLVKIKEGVWHQNQTDVLNGFTTSINYFTTGR